MRGALQEERLDMKNHKDQGMRQTNWKPILFWGAVIVALAVALIFDLNRIWLFVILMAACHLGHSMTMEKHH